MKNMIMILVSAVMGTLIMVMVMTIQGRMNRSVELQSNLSNIVEATVKNAMEKPERYQSVEEMTADCILNLAADMDTDSDLTVDVMKADPEKGLLSIRVEEQFTHPNGAEGSTYWERTAICDKGQMSKAETYKVRFYKSKAQMTENGDCYKTYMVQSGAHIAAPVAPVKKEETFVCCKDTSDYVADFSLPVEQDLIYYAEWRSK